MWVRTEDGSYINFDRVSKVVIVCHNNKHIVQAEDDDDIIGIFRRDTCEEAQAAIDNLMQRVLCPPLVGKLIFDPAP